MDAARWKQIDQLVDAAMEVPADRRTAFVHERSGGDADLAKQVIELLNAEDASASFLDQSAMRVAAKALAEEETHVSAVGFINKTVATYQIERKLGAGGMGEVYLAYDDKLKRKVALKILPPEFISNDERVKRFELEARAVAKLNHPGIVTVYDVGNFEGVNYIATEFVEGKTLRDLMGGKFKIRNIVLNSIQICDALAAAHAEGIIHRDIKPENIMIRKDGYAKILDFGLVKLTDPGQHTIRDMFATTKGVIIGTPAYMSPAQVSDDKVDHRTDLWSCGVVLYEFLTGKNPFKGANRQETFQAILTKVPEPCSSINPDIPEELDRIIAKMLEKDPNMGYQTAADLRADLKRVKREVDSSPSWTSDSGGLRHRASRRSFIPYAAGAFGLLILFAVAAGIYAYFSGPAHSTAIDWAAARNEPMTDQPGTEYYPSISPDGKEFVYAAEEDGDLDIFWQRVGSRARRNLTPDSPADDTMPAFSPNGQKIAFRSSRAPSGIYVMDVAGGDVRFVSDFGYHPSWSPDGTELAVSSFGRDRPTVRASDPGPLSVINVETGERRGLTDVEASFPAWSPNGHRIAYWFYTGTFGRRDIATIPAGGGDPVVVTNSEFAVSNWNPVWSPDGRYLYFVSSRAGKQAFWRVRIDETSGKVLSEPEAVMTPSSYSRHLSISNDGNRMLYVETNNQANIQGVDFDAESGRVSGIPYWITQGDREISRAELSADGSAFLMRLIRRTQDDIATFTREGGKWRDITLDEPFDRYSRWSPDGKRIAFTSDRNGGGQVWISNADGGGMRQITFNANDQNGTGFPVWSPDGTRLAVYFNGTTTLLDPNRSDREQEGEKLPFDPAYRIVVWDWSPDGTKLLGVIAEGDKRHLGYYDLETKQYKIVVENNENVPSWLPDSRRFIYSTGHRVHLADIGTRQTREIFVNPQVDIRSPFVSRDGKMLYYTAANYESDIWMLEMTAEK